MTTLGTTQPSNAQKRPSREKIPIPTATAPFSIHHHTTLNRRLVRNCRDTLRVVILRGDCPCFPGHRGLALQMHVYTLSLCLLHLLGVLLNTRQEVLTRAGQADVLDADVNTLLDIAIADLSVEDDTDSGFSNVVDDTSLAVVDLVGHAEWRLEYCSRTGDRGYCVSEENRGFH
jgi:hypothetical protein